MAGGQSKSVFLSPCACADPPQPSPGGLEGEQGLTAAGWQWGSFPVCQRGDGFSSVYFPKLLLCVSKSRDSSDHEHPPTQGNAQRAVSSGYLPVFFSPGTHILKVLIFCWLQRIRSYFLLTKLCFSDFDGLIGRFCSREVTDLGSSPDCLPAEGPAKSANVPGAKRWLSTRE